MVDLMALYNRQGLYVDGGELPDYLPLFLEFLSTQPHTEAAPLLAEPINIISVLGKRTKMKGSLYHLVFEVLEFLSPVKAVEKIVANAVTNSTEAVTEISSTDEEIVNLDAIWEEKPVRFSHPKLETDKMFGY
jgi:nitrate reductase delta subunit